MRSFQLAMAPTLPPGFQVAPDFNRLLWIVKHLAQLTERVKLHVSLHSGKESIPSLLTVLLTFTHLILLSSNLTKLLHKFEKILYRYF